MVSFALMTLSLKGTNYGISIQDFLWVASMANNKKINRDRNFGKYFLTCEFKIRIINKSHRVVLYGGIWPVLLIGGWNSLHMKFKN
jgi:hypothetical protein